MILYVVYMRSFRCLGGKWLRLEVGTYNLDVVDDRVKKGEGEREREGEGDGGSGEIER